VRRLVLLSIVLLSGVLVLVGSCKREPRSRPAPPPTPSRDAAVTLSKRAKITEMMRRGPVRIQLDARRADVTVPAKQRAESHLALRFGHDLSPPISDLSIDDHAIAGTLMFDGAPFHCVIPWSAVFGAIVENEPNGTVWPDAVPPELRHLLDSADAGVPLPGDAARAVTVAPAISSSVRAGSASSS
jgi:hypothetical protein